MDEFKRVLLPIGFRPEQVAIDKGEVVLLASNPASLAVITSTVSLIRLADDAAPVGIRLADHPEEIEVMNAFPPAIRTFKLGHLIGERELRPPIEITHASGTRHGWFISGTAEGVLEIYFFRQNEWKFLSGVDLTGGLQPRDFRLSNANGRAVLASTSNPFQLTVFDTSGHIVFNASAHTYDAQMYGFPAFTIGRVMVQTIADVRSDRYTMAIYDSAGKLSRARPLPAPMVLLGSTPGADTVVAARNLNGRSEIAFYAVRQTGILK